MKKDEALKRAREALLAAPTAYRAPETIAFIDEALAEQGCDYCNHPQYAGTKCKNCGREQPAQQQEPVAWMSAHRFDELRQGFTVMTTLTKQKAFEDDVDHHTSPPASKPLTDEQIDRAIAELGLNYLADASNNRAVLRELCRKAAHGIKGEA